MAIKKLIIFWTICTLAIALALSGCNRGTAASGSQTEPSASTQSTASVPAPEPTAEEIVILSAAAEPEQDAEQSYIDQVVQETIAKFAEPGMSEYEKAKAAFDYMIETTNLTEPVGLNLWRIRGNGGEPPSFVENRSLSVLLYGVGMCED